MLTFLLAFATMWCFAGNGKEALNHYGIMTVGNKSIETELGQRFKASGSPVFLVHDLKLGVAVGDLIRFADKAVLVDAAVMQTLQATGALQSLQQAPILRLRAKSQSSIWQGRSAMVNSQSERKAYLLGGEMLKILEDYFGGAPKSEEMVLRFEGQDMVLFASAEMIARLSFNQVRKVMPSGKPFLVSEPPTKKWFRGDSLHWRVWGADPSEPEASLRYSVQGDLPKGLVWNVEKHALEGRLDSVGTSSFSVWVRNPNGASDSMAVSIEVRENIPPLIAAEFLPPLSRGKVWLYHPTVADADHAAGDLHCHSERMPQGMKLDSIRCLFEWLVPLQWPMDTVIQIDLVVRDPLGGTARKEIEVDPAGVIPEILKGIRFVLPLDSLRQGQRLQWPVASLLSDEVQLLSLQGPDSCGLRPSGDSLWILPRKTGQAEYVFRLKAKGHEMELVQRVHVSANRPPVFASQISAWRLQEGDPLAYTPVALDPDGDSIRYKARTADGRFLRYQGGALDLWTRSSGAYSMDFIASDGFNAPVSQRVAYQVVPRRADWTGIEMRNRRMGPVSTWWTYYRSGSARVGIYSPKMNEVFRPAPPSKKEWAYGMLGASLLGETGMARGDYLWLDGAFQVRKPANKIITGGIMAGIDGRWTSKDNRYPWIFEFELQGHANQALFLVDTAGWGELDYQVTVDRSGNSFDIGDIETDSVLYTYLGPAYRKILDDASAMDNVVFALRLESWFPLLQKKPLGQLLVGPVFWREDYLITLRTEQRVGLGLRHTWQSRYLHLTHSVRAGLGGDNGPMRMWYDLTCGFGYWK